MHFRDQRCKAGIFALGKGRLDPAARIIQDPHIGCMLGTEALCRFRQVELDHFGRATANKKQRLDLRPPRKQLLDNAV